jgi:hypothetical protein
LRGVSAAGTEGERGESGRSGDSGDSGRPSSEESESSRARRRVGSGCGESGGSSGCGPRRWVALLVRSGSGGSAAVGGGPGDGGIGVVGRESFRGEVGGWTIVDVIELVEEGGSGASSGEEIDRVVEVAEVDTLTNRLEMEEERAAARMERRWRRARARCAGEGSCERVVRSGDSAASMAARFIGDVVVSWRVGGC